MRRALKLALACGILFAGSHALADDLPAGVKAQRDVVYAVSGGKSLKLDLYLPANANGAVPVIVRIAPHRETPARPANELLAHGYALIYADYLPDDAPAIQAFNRFPADIHAAKAVVRWARSNAAAQGLDPERIGIWGAEHGATLAALLSVTPDQPPLNGTLGDNATQSTAVRAVCLFGGTTDWRNAELYGDETVNIPGSPAYQLFGANPKENPDDARLASAVNYVRPTSPATLMVTLASDSNRAMHLIYAETLRRAGVPSALYEEAPGSGAGPGGHAVDEAKLDRTILDFYNDTLSTTHETPKMSLDQEIQQLTSASLYKQARRLVEEQVAITTGSDRQGWLTMLNQISDQQREPALQKLTAVIKQGGGGHAGPNTQWTIREVLTNPERIGEYQVETTLSQKTFDAHAETLKQIEALNQFVLQKDWVSGDRQLSAIQASLAYRDAFQAAVLNEAYARYQSIKSNPDQVWPPNVHPVGFATAFGQDLYGFWFDLRAGGALQRFRYIPPGSYLRGSSPDEWGRLPGEPPLVPTEIKDGFWISDSPITQQMMEGVMGPAGNRSHFRGPTLPADNVSYAHAINFINKLGIDARLPTTIEWEYATRAGARSPYPDTGRPSDIAWFWDEAATSDGGMNVRILNELETDRTTTARSTHPVKQKLPNAWGLYDMQGNVWEWCAGNSTAKARDLHPLRGGSWISIPQSCRAARETWLPVETESWNIGLRIVIPAQ